MFRTTLNNLRARKLRLLTTSLAVMLGVAFMAGTLVLTDTISTHVRRSVRRRQRRHRRRASAARPPSTSERVGRPTGTTRRRRWWRPSPTCPASPWPRATSRATPRSSTRTASRWATPTWVRPTNGGQLDRQRPTSTRSSSPTAARRGRRRDRHGPGQRRSTATSRSGRLRVQVITQAGVADGTTVVGIATFGGADSRGGASVTCSSRRRRPAADRRARQGRRRSRSLAADGVTDDPARRARSARPCPRGTEVLTGAEMAAEQTGGRARKGSASSTPS